MLDGLEHAHGAAGGGLLRQQLVFPLSAEPNPTTLAVTVDAVPVTNWQYDQGTRGGVSTAPAPGSTISISYDEPCP